MTDGTGDSGTRSLPDDCTENEARRTLTRRSTLAGLGLVGLLGLGVGSASAAEPSGQVGTEDRPLSALYAREIQGSPGGEEPFDVSFGGTRGLRLDGPTVLEIEDDDDVIEVEAGTNAVFGHLNEVTEDALGAVVGGGGSRTEHDGEEATLANVVTDSFGTIGGGAGNLVGDDDDDPMSALYATIAGGGGNEASHSGTTVAGGIENVASGIRSTVGGGRWNEATAGTATIGGGASNEATSTHTTVAGGINNTASANRSAIGGGRQNEATAIHATVGGGQRNVASGQNATIAGGEDNEATDEYATVGGGNYNDADADYATIAGGGPSDPEDAEATNNVVLGKYGTIGGGGGNQAGDESDEYFDFEYATVGGGEDNTANGDRSTVGGGEGNSATWQHATVGGGRNNESSDSSSTVSGGRENAAKRRDSTVGGGRNNEVDGRTSTISGGEDNFIDGRESTIGGGVENTVDGFATDAATIGGGENNTIDSDYSTICGGRDNTVTDIYSTVAGGRDNTADGRYSFAMGRDATAGHTGSVVWGNGSWDDPISSQSSNEFRCQMPMYAPSFNTTSARSMKTAVEAVDPVEVLNRVNSLEVSTWEFTAEDDSGRHMGPMAGEFADTFELGDDDESIATVDANGVALAAIQGLSERLAERDEVVENQASRIDDLEGENTALRERLTAIEARLDVAPRESASGNQEVSADD